MKLSVSNIGWASDFDKEIYEFLGRSNLSGLEIAPTRIFSDNPYEHLTEAKSFSTMLREKYNLLIPSMQSIWFGVTESIFSTDEEREKLTDYTKIAIDFAAVIDCNNLVFGCPKNRNIPKGVSSNASNEIATEFFNEIGNYAYSAGTTIAIEPNPPIYNTNFINTTQDAFDMCKRLSNPGLKVNVDVGTMIHYNDGVDILVENIQHINHVHFSEPFLVPLKRRELHKEIINRLTGAGYENFFSIEIGKQEDIQVIKDAVLYVRDNCCDL